MLDPAAPCKPRSGASFAPVPRTEWHPLHPFCWKVCAPIRGSPTRKVFHRSGEPRPCQTRMHNRQSRATVHAAINIVFCRGELMHPLDSLTSLFVGPSLPHPRERSSTFKRTLTPVGGGGKVTSAVHARQ